MTDFFLLMSVVILATVALGLLRIVRGPGDAERMMSAQLLGTGGVAVLALLAAALEQYAIIDVVLTLSILAAFSSIAFFQSALPGALSEAEDEQ